MKSITSRSLLPAWNCSRIVLRRSTASGACESARVWFWQTRQRSSDDRSMTRFSRFLFSSPKITVGRRRRRIKTNLFTLQLPHERHDLLLQHFRRHGADLLEADDSLLVDHV